MTVLPTRYGEDAAVVAGADDQCWVITTDPITFATDPLGWYAVQVNANDVAAMSAGFRIGTHPLPEFERDELARIL